jgi:hypothetical protein
LSNRRWIIRFPSGAVEHRYGIEPPSIGDVIGRNGYNGFVTRVDVDEHGLVTVTVGTEVPAGVTWDDLSPSDSPTTSPARRRILRRRTSSSRDAASAPSGSTS